MADQLQFSIIKQSQLAEVGRVYAKCFNLADIGEHWTNETATDFLTYLWKIQPDLFYVAIIDTKIVGAIAGIIKPWCDGAHIHEIELFVHPAHQRKGIASQLTKLLVETAVKKYGIVEFEGIADGDQHDFPLSWYKRIGVVSTGLIHIAGKPTDMLKRLAAK